MAKQEPKKPASVKVEVVRAFYYGGLRRSVGDVIDMSEVDYLQWRQGQKVKMVIPPPAPTEEKKPAPKSETKKEKDAK